MASDQFGNVNTNENTQVLLLSNESPSGSQQLLSLNSGVVETTVTSSVAETVTLKIQPLAPFHVSAQEVQVVFIIPPSMYKSLIRLLTT